MFLVFVAHSNYCLCSKHWLKVKVSNRILFLVAETMISFLRIHILLAIMYPNSIPMGDPDTVGEPRCISHTGLSEDMVSQNLTFYDGSSLIICHFMGYYTPIFRERERTIRDGSPQF